tara:strand:+ start:2439 stop:2681 length:243 start_codon:yes stop_codon:yes gene_type:complete
MNKFISKLSRVRGLNYRNDYLFQVENTKFRFIKIKKDSYNHNWKVVTYNDLLESYDFPTFDYVAHAKNLTQCKVIARRVG